jgi:hypothetical protein
VRIRHFGILSSSAKQTTIPMIFAYHAKSNKRPGWCVRRTRGIKAHGRLLD